MSNQRTLVMLEPPIRKAIQDMAQTEGVSISSLCRDLIRMSLEIVEDRYFDALASEREKGFDWKKKALTHMEVWGKKHK